MAGDLMRNARVFRAYASLHLKTAMEYRLNFFVQSGMMFLNDAMYVFIFFMLFADFGPINGYTGRDALLIYGISAFGYGLVAVFFGQVRNIWELIADGRMDLFLSQPVDALFHAYMSRSRFDGWGDILFGLIIMAWLVPGAILLGVLVGFLGAIVLLSFNILMDSIAFWVERPRHTIRSVSMAVLGFSSWPVESFGGIARVMIYVIPVVFIASVPRRILSEFSWPWFLALVLVAASLLVLSVSLFRRGIRRYEGGNLLTTRY